jgi:serine/threonine-protein kinase
MQQDDLIGTTLGNYRILAILGQGGMARVYKAYQENLDREVAVKVLPPWYAADRNFVERFKLEAKLIARLSHPNIVTIHDSNEQRGHLYIVMQFIDGGTLKHRMDQLHREGKFMDTMEVIPIFSQLAEALTYAHEQGIIHRDIKPVNVLMERSGRPILSDFGIAKVLASTQMNLTHPGAGVGTPEYMSPEQCQGGAVDGRADIYALGVMLFEAQTGRTPFQGDNYPALAHSHIYEAPPRPSSINAAIHPAVERVILTALMKNPQQRYQKASDMAEALKRVLTANTPPSPGYYNYRSQGSAPFIGQMSPSPADGRLSGLYSCYQCKHLNKPKMRFCVRCGYPLNQCTNCGERNPANNRFCIKCGQSLAV